MQADRDEAFDIYREVLYERTHTPPDASGLRRERTMNADGIREVAEAARKLAVADDELAQGQERLSNLLAEHDRI